MQRTTCSNGAAEWKTARLGKQATFLRHPNALAYEYVVYSYFVRLFSKTPRVGVVARYQCVRARMKGAAIPPAHALQLVPGPTPTLY